MELQAFGVEDIICLAFVVTQFGEASSEHAPILRGSARARSAGCLHTLFTDLPAPTPPCHSLSQAIISHLLPALVQAALRDDDGTPAHSPAASPAAAPNKTAVVPPSGNGGMGGTRCVRARASA